MAPTAADMVRHSPTCHEDVHIWNNPADAREHTRVGHCITIFMGLGLGSDELPRADAGERGAQLAEALSRLPERKREALILQKYLGWRLAQIAEHLGCTPRVVPGLQATGLKRLRKLQVLPP